MSPRLRTKRATLTALLLVSDGCVIGGVHAIAPTELEGDGGTISVSESPSLESAPDAAQDRGDEEDPPDAAVLDGAESSCDGGLCVALPSGCTSASFEEHVYVFCEAQETWDAARASCLNLGLDLVIIESAAENAFVAQRLSAPSWIGASDQTTEGSFTWVEPGGSLEGAALSFTSWAPAVPDNCGGIFGQQDCARISQDGSWDDSDCAGGCLEGTFGSVCESY